MGNRFHNPFPPYDIITRVPAAQNGQWVDEKNMDIRHAIKFFLRIGVTSTLDVGKDRLADWKMRRAIWYCMDMPYRGGFDPDTHSAVNDDYNEWEAEILSRVSDHVGEFADDGTRVDTQLKNYFSGKKYDLHDDILPCVDEMTKRAKELGVIKIVAGTRLASDLMWVTGEPDFLGFNATGKLVWCLDLKRKNKSTFDRAKTERGLDENHRLQLGHYNVMLKEHHDSENSSLDLLLSCRDTKRAKLIPIEDADRWDNAAIYHNKSWFLRKGWNPQAGWSKEKERIRTIMDAILQCQ